MDVLRNLRDTKARPGIVKTMSAPIDLQAIFIPNDGEFFRVKLALEIAIDEVVLSLIHI